VGESGGAVADEKATSVGGEKRRAGWTRQGSSAARAMMMGREGMIVIFLEEPIRGEGGGEREREKGLGPSLIRARASSPTT
jgi:hypothetical protein